MNTWKIIYLNCVERYEDMIDYRIYAHNSSCYEWKPEKNLGLNGIRTHDLSMYSTFITTVSIFLNC